MYEYGTDKVNIEAYSVSDYASDTVDAKSTSGTIININSSPITWFSTKQTSVALSTMEAEFMSLVKCTKTVIHLQSLLTFLNHPLLTNHKITIFGDNTAANLVISHDILNNRTRHIRTNYHFIKELLENNVIELRRCDSNSNLAD